MHIKAYMLCFCITGCIYAAGLQSNCVFEHIYAIILYGKTAYMLPWTMHISPDMRMLVLIEIAWMSQSHVLHTAYMPHVINVYSIYAILNI